MRIFGIKIGYIILLIIAIIFGIRYYFDDSKEVALYSKNIINSINDLKNRNYFQYQNRLSNDLKSIISIEQIKNFANSLTLSKSYKFILKNYKKDKNKIIINGVLITNSTKIPIQTQFSDVNKTLLIDYQKIGNFEIKESNLTFPIICKKGN